jgi:hypothetical protein
MRIEQYHAPALSDERLCSIRFRAIIPKTLPKYQEKIILSFRKIVGCPPKMGRQK